MTHFAYGSEYALRIRDRGRLSEFVDSPRPVLVRFFPIRVELDREVLADLEAAAKAEGIPLQRFLRDGLQESAGEFIQSARKRHRVRPRAARDREVR